MPFLHKDWEKNQTRLKQLDLPKDHWTLKTGYFEDPNLA